MDNDDDDDDKDADNADIDDDDDDEDNNDTKACRFSPSVVPGVNVIKQWDITRIKSSFCNIK